MIREMAWRQNGQKTRKSLIAGSAADAQSMSEAAADEVTAAWVAARGGLARAALTPMPGALAWRIDGDRPA
jgi:hypothetical protein